MCVMKFVCVCVYVWDEHFTSFVHVLFNTYTQTHVYVWDTSSHTYTQTHTNLCVCVYVLKSSKSALIAFRTWCVHVCVCM